MSSLNKKTKTAVLFVNLGTADAATPVAVRRYLTEFLLDRHVVDLPAFFWKPLLTWFILPKRLPNTLSNYRKIWQSTGSPLAFYSDAVVKSVRRLLPKDWHCALAMTYGNPSLTDVLTTLKHYDKIKVIPMFPQYSTTTTLAVTDRIKEIINTWDKMPAFEILYDYAGDDVYIAALAEQITASFSAHGCPDALLLSYHGIPMQYVKKRNDPYLERCKITTTGITKALQEKGITVPVIHGYQSRFGKGRWSEPNTADILIRLAQNDCHHVQVLCPGFAVDCIETLEEIAGENQERFLLHGGKKFHYIPALNGSAIHGKLMKKLLERLF